MENINGITTNKHVSIIKEDYGIVLQVETDSICPKELLHDEYKYYKSLLCDKKIERYPLPNRVLVNPEELLICAKIIASRDGDICRGLKLQKSTLIDIHLPSKYRAESLVETKKFDCSYPVKFLVNGVDCSNLFDMFEGVNAPSLIYNVAHTFFKENKLEKQKLNDDYAYKSSYQMMDVMLNNLKCEEKNMIAKYCDVDEMDLSN